LTIKKKRTGEQKMRVSEARENVGRLSNPSKMPSKSYGLPAQACKVGGKLRAVKGSTCENCYAYDRGMYGFPVVKKAQARRLATITREDWAPSMARAINKDKYFRWHDSGDIQNVEHFAKIVEVARATPRLPALVANKRSANGRIIYRHASR
jgi:hypothetical protein